MSIDYYLEEDVQRMTDEWLITETTYVMRQSADIDEVAQNEEYIALVMKRLEHLTSEVARREKLARNGYTMATSGKVSADKLEDIKARLTPLDRVIGQYIVLRKSGALHVAHCPFHEERVPSFTVYSDHYFCFSCKTGGDVFSWLMQMNQVSTFGDAVKVAANMAGVDLTPPGRGLL